MEVRDLVTGCAGHMCAWGVHAKKHPDNSLHMTLVCVFSAMA